jgi:hypothetical protein
VVFKTWQKFRVLQSEDEDASDIDNEVMALLVRKMGKFIKKRGYGARKRRDHMKEHVRLCYKCKSPDHIIADCPYNSDNEEDKKEKKEEKKKKKEKKMTFKKKKKGSDYVVTCDSDCTEDNDDDDSSDDNKKLIKKTLASIAIHNNSSLFDTPSTCLMAKPTKVKYDESDDECESDDEEDYSKEELIDMCDQLSSGFEKKRKECKTLQKSSKLSSNPLGSSKHLMSV